MSRAINPTWGDELRVLEKCGDFDAATLLRTALKASKRTRAAATSTGLATGMSAWAGAKVLEADAWAAFDSLCLERGYRS